MKSVMNLVAIAAGLTAGAAMLSIGPHGANAHSTPENAAHPRTSCNSRTIKGSYGIQMQGTRNIPGSTGVEQVIGVVTRTFDGKGGFKQIDNVKGAVSGIAFDRPGSGTYVVNADCTGRTLFQPAPGVSIEERFIVVDYGFEMHSITVSPEPLMVTSVGKRVGWR